MPVNGACKQIGSSRQLGRNLERTIGGEGESLDSLTFVVIVVPDAGGCNEKVCLISFHYPTTNLQFSSNLHGEYDRDRKSVV